MTAETDLLPLPEPDYLMPQGHGWPDIPAWSENTVRQIVAHATAPLQAEIEALRAEVAEWKASFQQAADGHATYAERAEQLAEELREAKEKMLARVKWVACDCGCGGDKPADAVSIAWLRASTLLHEQEEGK